MSASRARPRLIAIWTVLAALIAVIVVVRHHDASALADQDSHGHGTGDGVRWLLPAPIEQIGAIEVAHAGAVHRFERDGAGAWFHHGAHAAQDSAHPHQADPRTAKRIAQVLNGFGRTRIERSFPLDGAAGGVVPVSGGTAPEPRTDGYGVTVPALVVLVYDPLAVQPRVQYAVGDVAPDGHSRYVLPVGSATVLTIANYQIASLLDLIAEAASAMDSGQADGRH